MKTDYTLESLRPLSMSAIATPNPAAVDQSVTFTPAPPPVDTTDLYGYWPLDEASGNARASTLGTAPDLAEVGGAVPEVAGRFSNAASSAETDTFALSGALAPALAVSAGLTISFWFKWPAYSSGLPKTMFALDNVGVTPTIHVIRFYGSDFMDVAFAWAAGQYVILPLPRLGNFAVDTWHLLVLTYDPATGVFTGRVDDGCMSSATVWTAAPLPALKLEATVPPASLVAANASTFSRLRLLKAFNGNFVNFEGALDDLRIWTRALTATEIEDLWTEAAPCGDIPPYTYRWQFEQGLLGNGLIHSWALDESPSGTRHDSKGTCDLTEVGNVPAVAGLVGNAADMTSGYLWGPALTEALTQKFTFAITFKAPVTDGSYWGLFYIANAFFIGLLQNRVYAEVDAWTDHHASWGPVSADGLWHTVILWVDRDEDNRIQSSLDGAATVYSALPITGTFNVDPGLGSSVYVGNVGENTGVPTGLVVQRLLWWNRSLTAEERATVLTYQSGEESPVHTYSTPGTKVASVTVTSAHGCVATRTVAVVVS